MNSENAVVEHQLLGKLLLYPELFQETRIQPKHFGDPLAREALTVSLRLADSGVTPSLMSLHDASEALHRHPVELASMTTDAYLGELSEIEAAVMRGYRMRELRRVSRMLPAVLGEEGDPIAWLDEELTKITQETAEDKIYTQREVLFEVMDQLEARYNLQGELPGLSTGFWTLDRYMLGLQPRRLYYVGARPSQGKSALVGQIAMNVALSGAPVGYIALESSRAELFMRNISNQTRIDNQTLATGNLKQAQFAQITASISKLDNAPIYVYDVPNLPIARIKSTARVMVRKHKIRLLVVDYLQLILAGDARMPRHERVAQASVELKELARTLNIPVLCAAQLRRDSDQGNRKPTISDFSDSSQIEKDADAAILLAPREDSDVVDAIFAKNRDGQKGVVALRFIGKHTRFEEYKEHEGD